METYWVNCEKSEANKNFSVRRNRLMVVRKKNQGSSRIKSSIIILLKSSISIFNIILD